MTWIRNEELYLVTEKSRFWAPVYYLLRRKERQGDSPGGWEAWEGEGFAYGMENASRTSDLGKALQWFCSVAYPRKEYDNEPSSQLVKLFKEPYPKVDGFSVLATTNVQNF